MNVMEAIQERRSVRHFKPDEIPDEVLTRLLNAMRLAPSASNRQPWKFIVVRDKGIKEQFAAACVFEVANGKRNTQAWIAEAPVVIVACGLTKEAGVGYYKDGIVVITKWSSLDEELKSSTVDFLSAVDENVAIALDHLTLAARAENLGTCWIGAMNEPKVKELLCVPEENHVHLAVALGYPVEWPGPRPRKTLEQIICYDKYSE